MKKTILFFVCLSFISLHNSFAQHPDVSQIDSLEILEQAGLKVMFFEAALNYLADPYAKSTDVIQHNSYRPGYAKRIFMDGEVQIENDLNPGIYNSTSPPVFISAEEYMDQFRAVYNTDDPKSVTFRVSKLRSLIPTEKGYEVHIFFESTFGGQYEAGEGMAYQKTNRIATLRVERVGQKWHAYITKVAFASPKQVEYYVPQEYKAHIEKMKELEQN